MGAVGWALGLVVVASIAYLAGDGADAATDEDASNGVFALKAVLGVLLLLALRQWRGRPKPGDPPALPPKWMQGIDRFTPVKSFGLAVLLAGPNPKNLLLSIAAGTTIAQLGATGADAWVAILVYALLGTVTVGGPVLYYFAAGKQAEEHLNELKGWLGANIDPLVAREFPQYGSSLLLVFAMRMAAMFVLTTSNVGRTSGILPRWFVYVGFAMTLGLLLTASLNSWLVVVFPAWIIVFCAILVDRARRIPRGLVVSEPAEVVARSAT